jgi:hypothetical protein
LQAVSVSAKLTGREAELLDRLTREYGFVSKKHIIKRIELSTAMASSDRHGQQGSSNRLSR